jgi:hypothetical protein
MGLIRYLARSISILNLLLAGAIAAILAYALFPLLGTKMTYRPQPAKEREVAAMEKPVPAPPPVPSEYTVVAENNLFHPERRIPPDKKEEKLLPKPELTLYGTVITDDLSIAYIEDKKSPYSTPGRGKRPRAMKKGDVISGFVLKNIETNRITLTRNEEVGLDTAKIREDQPSRGQPTTTAPGQAPAQRPVSSGSPTVPGSRPTTAGTAPVATPRAAPAPALTVPPTPVRASRLPTRQ